MSFSENYSFPMSSNCGNLCHFQRIFILISISIQWREPFIYKTLKAHRIECSLLWWLINLNKKMKWKSISRTFFLWKSWNFEQTSWNVYKRCLTKSDSNRSPEQIKWLENDITKRSHNFSQNLMPFHMEWLLHNSN